MTRTTTAATTARTSSDLGAVQAALLERARGDADAERAAAAERGRALLAAARQQADEIVSTARAEGAADAAEALRGERARTRRAARARVLRAERTAYDELRRRCVEQVAALVGSEDALLAAEAADVLGPGAGSDDDGAAAVAGGRRLRIVPADLVDRALRDLGDDVAGLWSP